MHFYITVYIHVCIHVQKLQILMEQISVANYSKTVACSILYIYILLLCM